jgi:HD-GYP domain-containing protein (c-di-GMP phosphodiesterase class II)
MVMESLDNFFSDKKDFGVNEIIAYLTELEKIVKEGRDSLKERLTKLTRIVDRKIPYRDGHSIRVSLLSVEIAKILKLKKEDIFNIEIAALLHDFGKIAIEERVLQKKDSLTEEDWIEIKMHPVRGYMIVQGFTFLKGSLDGIRWHHERYNGTGYPDRLKGDQIPEMARIIAVSDAFDAMIQKRPYKDKIKVNIAKKILENNMNILFDEKVVKAFLDIPEERFYTILNAEW